jgi:hypothetical protein
MTLEEIIRRISERKEEFACKIEAIAESDSSPDEKFNSFCKLLEQYNVT